MRRKHGNNQDLDDDDDDDDELGVTESGSTAVTCFVRLPCTLKPPPANAQHPPRTFCDLRRSSRSPSF